MISSNHGQTPGKMFSEEEPQAGECAPRELCGGIKLSSGLATSRGRSPKGQAAHFLAAKPAAEHPDRGRRSAGWGPKTGPQNSFNRCSVVALTAQSTERSGCTQTSHRKCGLINTSHKSSRLAWYFRSLSCREEETRGESWSFVSLGGKKGSSWSSQCMEIQGRAL